jgi:hypothetical protein
MRIFPPFGKAIERAKLPSRTSPEAKKQRYVTSKTLPPWGRPQELTCLEGLVIVTFVVEATGREIIVDAGQFLTNFQQSGVERANF